uniref:UBX domain-containing protein 6 n=1 Tax=Anthurium amnicola TaxID=1678845 RepID=A0A1D1XPS9_9ARAE
MEDVKDKMKGFMKKVNKSLSSSSSSGKFQGQGRVLGSGATSSGGQPGGASPLVQRFSTTPSTARPNHHNPPARPSGCTAGAEPKPPAGLKPSADQFSPFDTLISSGKRSVNVSAPEVFECPVCSRPYATEGEVSVHVEACLAANGKGGSVSADGDVAQAGMRDDLAGRVGEFVSSEPPGESVEVVLRLMRNVVREPENDKFRKIRMSNPKIKQAVCTVGGAVELLESVGFRLEEEDGETWAKMDSPAEKEITMINEVITLLERLKLENSTRVPSVNAVDSLPEPEKVDRQVRVFFSVPESEAAKIDLPDSFYNLSAEELKREVELRKKKMSESQILVPKSYKEKQMKAARKKYKATCIRVQFPDGVVLQGVFLPSESTTALYEFVSVALKEPSLEFELLRPAVPKMQVIPRFSRSGERPPTLEEEDLVPSALVKFKAMETDSILFTGLTNDLLEIIEPFTITTIHS